MSTRTSKAQSDCGGAPLGIGGAASAKSTPAAAWPTPPPDVALRAERLLQRERYAPIVAPPVPRDVLDLRVEAKRVERHCDDVLLRAAARVGAAPVDGSGFVRARVGAHFVLSICFVS